MMARAGTAPAAQKKVYNIIARTGRATRVQINRECPEFSTEYIRQVLGCLVSEGRVIKDDKREWPPVYRVVGE